VPAPWLAEYVLLVAALLALAATGRRAGLAVRLAQGALLAWALVQLFDLHLQLAPRLGSLYRPLLTATVEADPRLDAAVGGVTAGAFAFALALIARGIVGSAPAPPLVRATMLLLSGYVALGLVDLLAKLEASAPGLARLEAWGELALALTALTVVVRLALRPTVPPGRDAVAPPRRRRDRPEIPSPGPAPG